MKIQSILTCLTIMIAIFACIMPRVNSLEAAVPGKSLWGVALGSSRAQAVAAAQARFSYLGGKREASHHFSQGLLEDKWDVTLSHTDESLSLEVLSQYGRVVQLRSWDSRETGQTSLTFAELIKRHQLKKSVYGFDSPDGDGYECFYYDDIPHGVCFSRGVNAEFLLTLHPDALIVHRPGFPVIAIADGLHGKKDSGPNTRAFSNAAEARRAEQHNQNDY